jgi:hypothetical protein
MAENKMASSQQASDDTEFSTIPSDFPRSAHLGALPGSQPKFLVINYKDRFYQPGSTPPEMYERWELCESLAVQLANKSVESKAGKRAHMSEVEILAQYLPRLIAQQWTSEAEARWIIRRVAQMLTWPAPSAAQEVVTDAPPSW